jgi:hypothetical protein
MTTAEKACWAEIGPQQESVSQQVSEYRRDHGIKEPTPAKPEVLRTQLWRPTRVGASHRGHPLVGSHDGTGLGVGSLSLVRTPSAFLRTSRRYDEAGVISSKHKAASFLLPVCHAASWCCVRVLPQTPSAESLSLAPVGRLGFPTQQRKLGDSAEQA